jgi:hypothetical protein
MTTIAISPLDNASLFLYKTLETYNRISGVYELALSIRIASSHLQSPCGAIRV